MEAVRHLSDILWLQLHPEVESYSLQSASGASVNCQASAGCLPIRDRIAFNIKNSEAQPAIICMLSVDLERERKRSGLFKAGSNERFSIIIILQLAVLPEHGASAPYLALLIRSVTSGWTNDTTISKDDTNDSMVCDSRDCDQVRYIEWTN